MVFEIGKVLVVGSIFLLQAFELQRCTVAAARIRKSVF